MLERHYDTVSNGEGRLSYHVNYTVKSATGNGFYSRLIIGEYDALCRLTSQTNQSKGGRLITFPFLKPPPL